ncbi:vWA domain-containing protein [Thetidibacter halocola]|uniref:Metal-dependent peptidase n=1 Tax=Thetidibacter halocola TaxID=2827239 RepID=A0A8J7WD07_9RHOB|nr:hypothetical protein [Thetidibacter halocola]
MSHSVRAARALAHLAERDPALSVLALWCAHRDGDRTETRGTRIFYGPEFDSLTLAEQIGTVGHHVLHVSLRHPARQAAMALRFGPGFDAGLFGLVADALINETLLLAEHGLPRPAVTVTGLVAAAGLPQQSPAGALAAWDAERLYLRLAGDETVARAACAHGAERGWQPDLSGEDGQVARDDAGTADAADWQGRLSRAMHAGRRAGIGIGAIGVPLADLAPPRVAWERRLRGLVDRAVTARPQPVWHRPAGRWVAMEAQARASGRPVPVFAPQHRLLNPRPSVVVALDLSSSIDTPTLRLFGAEIGGIVARSGAEAHLLTFDTELDADLVLTPGAWRAQIEGQPLRRGGGTDFRPVLARAGQIAPSIAVILTDLEGPTGAAPRFPVLWAVPRAAPSPPFGRVLRLDEGAA